MTNFQYGNNSGKKTIIYKYIFKYEKCHMKKCLNSVFTMLQTDIASFFTKLINFSSTVGFA